MDNIPNINQLLLVCGIALAVVLAIVLVLIKMPKEGGQDTDKWE